MLRRSRERCSRNSAKKLGVTFGRCPAPLFLGFIRSNGLMELEKRGAAAKVYLATVYLKHRSLQNRKVKYRG